MIQMTLDDKALHGFLSDAIKQGQNLQPFFVATTAILHSSAMINFQTGGRPKKWTPLSGWTMRNRVAGKTVAGHGLGQPILNASGKLRMSIGSVREITSTSLTYGTAEKYAALQQFGGTVTPKKGKYLTLPFPGVTGSARQYENVFFRKSKAGNLVMFQKVEKGLRPLFLLVKSVTIPSRPYLLFQKKDVNEIANLAAAFLFDPQGYARLAGRAR